MKFQEQDIPTNSLKELGFHDGENNLLPQQIKDQLLRGQITEFVELKNIPVNGENISLDAKLSLKQKADGQVGLFIHPIYSKNQEHTLLTKEENDRFQDAGVHKKQISAYGTLIESGAAKYQFEKDAQSSFYVRLLKEDGKEVDIWGVDLERALTESKHQIGDKVQLQFEGKQNVLVDVPQKDVDGNIIGVKKEEKERNTWKIDDFVEEKKQEKVLLFEYDQDTRSFVGVDSDDVLVPVEINGMRLSPEQKREFKDGKEVTLEDDTTVQLSPASPNNMRSNRRWLLASVLVDGGISFLMYHILKSLLEKKKEPREDVAYKQGYLDALNKVKGDLERKQQQFPNDKRISADLNILGKEISRANVVGIETPDISNKNINETKSKVNDPELDDNALEKDKEIKHSVETKVEEKETQSAEIKVEHTKTTETEEEKTQSTGMKR